MVERSPRPVGSPDKTDRQRVAAHTTASGAPATVELAASGLVLAGEPLAANQRSACFCCGNQEGSTARSHRPTAGGSTAVGTQCPACHKCGACFAPPSGPDHLARKVRDQRVIAFVSRPAPVARLPWRPMLRAELCCVPR
jgi:hypothetical protein